MKYLGTILFFVVLVMMAVTTQAGSSQGGPAERTNVDLHAEAEKLRGKKG